MLAFWPDHRDWQTRPILTKKEDTLRWNSASGPPLGKRGAVIGKFGSWSGLCGCNPITSFGYSATASGLRRHSSLHHTTSFYSSYIVLDGLFCGLSFFFPSFSHLVLPCVHTSTVNIPLVHRIDSWLSVERWRLRRPPFQWNVSSTWSYHGRILSLAALIKFDYDMTVLNYIPHSPDQLQWQTIWHIVRPPPDIHFPSHWHWKDSAPHHLSLTTSQHRQASAPASVLPKHDVPSQILHIAVNEVGLMKFIQSFSEVFLSFHR